VVSDAWDDLVDGLEGMPEELRAAAARMGESRWREAPAGAFCIIEQAWHLADLEREGYGERIRRLLAEDDPILPDFDGARVAAERSYRSQSFEEGVAAFAGARAANIAVLRRVPASARVRRGHQDGVGVVTLGDVPRMMREHDDSHRAEIAALLAGTAAPRPAWA